MFDCLEAHDFAIVKGVLPDGVEAGLREVVWEGTDAERTLGPGSRAPATPGSSRGQGLGRCGSTSPSWRSTGT